MRVGIGQINPLVGDVQGNTRLILSRVAEARAAGCRLVVFPKFAIPGHAPLGLVRRPGFIEACDAAVEEIRAASAGMAIVIGSVAGAPAAAADAVTSSVVAIDDGAVLATIAGAAVEGSSLSVPDVPRDVGVETTRIAGLRFGIATDDDLGSETMDVFSALGADWVLHLAASFFHVGCASIRREAARRAAVEAGLGIVFANSVGGVDGPILDGGSLVVAASGKLLLQAARFEDGLFAVDLDSKRPVSAEAEAPTSEISAAIVLGIRDYVRKNGFDRVVIGLSGGVDSAVTAALAVEALGAEAVIGTFIPCEHSSERSRADARALASNLGIELVEIPATDVHKELRTALPFQAAGIVDENLQARARAVLWMALANERRALVLAAGNKTEAAVGYATLYGDTTGALAPIGDLYKDEVYRLALFLGPRIPRSILEKAPSAELRPGQRDDDDLPPYPILDRLLRALIDENASRSQLIARGFEESVVDDVLCRFYASEFKRRQTPPAIVVSRAPLSRHRVPLTHAYRG
jgi:NAD+ synthase (glutamine-hydrolysing)